VDQKQWGMKAAPGPEARMDRQPSSLNGRSTASLGAPLLDATLSVVGSDPQGNRLAFELPSGSVGGCPLRSLSNGYCLRLGVVMLEWSKPFAVSSWTVSG